MADVSGVADGAADDDEDGVDQALRRLAQIVAGVDAIGVVQSRIEKQFASLPEPISEALERRLGERLDIWFQGKVDRMFDEVIEPKTKMAVDAAMTDAMPRAMAKVLGPVLGPVTAQVDAATQRANVASAALDASSRDWGASVRSLSLWSFGLSTLGAAMVVGGWVWVSFSGPLADVKAQNQVIQFALSKVLDIQEASDARGVSFKAVTCPGKADPGLVCTRVVKATGSK